MPVYVSRDCYVLCMFEFSTKLLEIAVRVKGRVIRVDS